MIALAYLWKQEADAGHEEGFKDRPVVVVATRQLANGRTRVVAAPITHSPPDGEAEAIEIPPRVRQHLGLDDERNWIVVTEVNAFTWPGPDIRRAPGKDTPLYDVLPETLFERVKGGIDDHHQGKQLSVVKRTE